MRAGEALVEVVNLEEHPAAVGVERAKVVLFVRVVGVTKVIEHRDGLDDPGNGFDAEGGDAGGHHRGLSSKILAQFIVQRADARSHGVHDGPPIWFWRKKGVAPGTGTLGGQGFCVWGAGWASVSVRG